MNKYKSMTDGDYFLAMDEFIARYNAPQPEPVEKLELYASREEADEILRGDRKVIIRPFTDSYWEYMTDHVVDEWMTAHRDSFGMDMEAFKEFMCATRPVEKIHLHDEQETWFIDTICIENGLIPVNSERIKDLNNRFDCKDLNRLLLKVENRKDVYSEPPHYYYFVIGDVIGTEKDETESEKKRADIIELKKTNYLYTGNNCIDFVINKRVALAIASGKKKDFFIPWSKWKYNDYLNEIRFRNKKQTWYVRVACKLMKPRLKGEDYRFTIDKVIDTNMNSDIEYIEFEVDNNDPNIRKRWLLRKALIFRKYAVKFPRDTDSIKMKFEVPNSGWLPISFYKNKAKMGTFVTSNSSESLFKPLIIWLESVAKNSDQASIMKLTCEEVDVVFSFEPMWFWGVNDVSRKKPHPSKCGIFTVFSSENGGKFLIDAYCQAKTLANELYTEILDFAWKMSQRLYEPFKYTWDVNNEDDIPDEYIDKDGNVLPTAWIYFMDLFHSNILSDLRADKRRQKQSSTKE